MHFFNEKLLLCLYGFPLGNNENHIYGMLGFPHSSIGTESACNAGDLDSIPGSGRFPGEGNGNPFQHPCLENPMDRGA